MTPPVDPKISAEQLTIVPLSLKEANELVARLPERKRMMRRRTTGEVNDHP